MDEEKKKYWVEVFGCQMNIRDSQIIESQLKRMGYTPARTPEESDLYYIQTCSVREKAEHKLYSLLGSLKKWKKESHGRKVVVGGCVAQQERERILEKAPHVDLVLGTHETRNFQEHFSQILTSGTPLVRVKWHTYDELNRLSLADEPKEGSPVAYVTIQEGCDEFCTFCVVPFTRGREISRPPETILEEIKRHLSKGAKEIVLLGQNVNAYGKKNQSFPTFVELLYQIGELKEVKRIRFTSPHPKYYGPDLIQAYREIPTLTPQAHLPLQSGSNEVLKRMNRGYTKEEYLHIVEELKKARPEIQFSTDIIVGFPGETEEDFQETMEVIEKVRFSQVYSFLFSPRPFTKARLFPDPVPETVKRQWLYHLQKRQEEIQEEDHRKSIGTTVEVLWEVHEKGVLKGRSPQGRVVHAQGDPALVGEITSVLIDRTTPYALYGKILHPSVPSLL